jgi:1,4-dihydroxy-2-naphthoate octaprenyltransferase
MLNSGMNFIRKFIPSLSALLHLRLLFSVFLLPVFLFALSQATDIRLFEAILTFVIWHLLVYPASNGYNSYFDKDEGSIALIEKPPAVDKSLYYFSLLLDAIALVLTFFVGWILFWAVLIYGVISKMYSHPRFRLKKYPIISFLIVFIFQGAFIYWSTYASIGNFSFFEDWDFNFILAGLISSCLIGATYPLTQVYQHAEDSKRGDTTLSIVLGIRGSFYFSAILFLLSGILVYFYWESVGLTDYFWLFLLVSSPVLILFTKWFYAVYKDPAEANFKNMSRMTLISSIMMLIYFGILAFT